MQDDPPSLEPHEHMSSAPLPPRDRLLAAATNLFGRYGINAVGVDAIVEAASTAKTTLYKAFGSKEGLVEVVLEQAGQRWRAKFIEQIDGPGGSARDRLDRIFPALQKWFDSEHYFGCPFINAVGEHDKSDQRFRKIAIVHKNLVLDRIEALLTEFGSGDARDLREQVAILMDGAIATSMTGLVAHAGDKAQRTFQVLLGAQSDTFPLEEAE